MNTANVENRGYLKIKGTVGAFNFDFRDKVVLDIGSSTGGFTEFALQNGAKKVIAVEKGSHQMKAPLRFDPRIELHEKTDIFDVVAKTKVIPPEGQDQQVVAMCSTEHEDLARAARSVSGGHAATTCWSYVALPDVIMADVSFISLKPILKYARGHLSDKNTDFLVMLKPQFEAKPYELNKGIVKNEKIRREIIKSFEMWLKTNGFHVINKRDNALQGKHGNTERFYWLKTT